MASPYSALRHLPKSAIQRQRCILYLKFRLFVIQRSHQFRFDHYSPPLKKGIILAGY
jgi:hypothetical protein